MRAIVQRVITASVTVQECVVGHINNGLLVLIGIAQGDGRAEATLLAEKTMTLRIFADEEGRFNRSLLDVNGEVLVVSQFTLYADIRKGRRPSFTHAAAPDVAASLIDDYVAALQTANIPVQTGVFGAMMHVSLVNDGPVTIILDSDLFKRPCHQS
jgi:D-aminoacyl-tRNA deacylase